MINTECLIIKPHSKKNLLDLFKILGDAETMKFYPKPYTFEETELVIEKSIQLYLKDKIGFFAVFLKSNNKLIGNFGITIKNIDGSDQFNIGYHFNKKYWVFGYTTEAAIAVKKYGFEKLKIKKLFSYMSEDHFASRKVAERNGMKLEKIYNNPKNRNLPTTVYSVLNPTN